MNQAQVLAHGISMQGSLPGDIVVLANLPALEMVLALWGCSMGGFIALPLNTRYPMNELLHLLDSLKPSLCISDQPVGQHSTILFRELLQIGQSASPPIPPLFNCELAATLLMTSGSSGSAKLVQHSHLNHLSSARGSNTNIPLNPASRWLLVLPLYHIGGLAILYRSVLAGSAVILPDPSMALVDSMQNSHISHVSLVSTQFKRLLEAPEAPSVLSGLEAILLGGSEIPQSLIDRAIAHSLPIYLSYGSTEMASQITTTRAGKITPHSINSGTLLADRDLIISHEGEILVKGATLAQGYRQGSSLTDIRDHEGWFHTGDVGYVDVHGSLTVTGRMDNQFISGGENIQPEHIESMLCKMDGISQALVLPKPDTEFGVRPIAFIQLDNLILTAKEIDSFLRKALPGYMIPIAYFHIPGVLMEKSLKLSRHELEEVVRSENYYLHTVR